MGHRPSLSAQSYRVISSFCPSTAHNWVPRPFFSRMEKGDIQDGDEEHWFWSQTDWILVPALTYWLCNPWQVLLLL